MNEHELLDHLYTALHEYEESFRREGKACEARAGRQLTEGDPEGMAHYELGKSYAYLDAASHFRRLLRAVVRNRPLRERPPLTHPRPKEDAAEEQEEED